MTNPARSRLVTGHRIFITGGADLTYDEQRAALLADLDGKRFRGDWHGVSDAANDLRVLEAEQKVRTEFEERELGRPSDSFDVFRYASKFLNRAYADEFARRGTSRIHVDIPFRYQFDNRASPCEDRATIVPVAGGADSR